jgi:pimeloyl-ACP methyl ester carboxylesterase
MATPFTVAIPEEVLVDLRQRLAGTRWPGQIAAYGWQQGSELAYVKELARYWQQDYDWRSHEAEINTFDHALADISGHTLHFIHARSPHEEATPLLLLHGWPGSFYEYLKIIPLLTQPEEHGATAAEAFHVVVASLPGFIFSPAPTEPGMFPRRMGELMHGLMKDELGYRRYGVQGGDWGAVVTSWMAFDQPDSVIGLHLNIQGVRGKIGKDGAPLDNDEKAYLANARRRYQEDMGYYAIQGTRPQTLGYGLTDSPTGLLAWLTDKFREWTDCGGDLETSLSRDEFLTNVMLYWVTGCIASSTRVYFEHLRAGDHVLPDGARIETPTGFANFPAEIYNPPRRWMDRAYNIVQWTDMPSGGHFAAFETPEMLAADMRDFFRGLEK